MAWNINSHFQLLFNRMPTVDTPPIPRVKHDEPLPLNNNLIFECNYYQPGTNGITINTHLGLNTLEPSTSSINIFPSATLYVNQSNAVTWQFMDEDGIWKDYEKPEFSLDSMDIERHYQSNPLGNLEFQLGFFRHTLYFNGMYHLCHAFNSKRHVRRIVANDSSTLSHVKWQYRDTRNGCWKDYVKGTGRGKCNISTQQIEMQYQQNRSGTMRFSSEKFSYQLNFSDMTQENLSTGKRRLIRRFNL